MQRRATDSDRFSVSGPVVGWLVAFALAVLVHPWYTDSVKKARWPTGNCEAAKPGKAMNVASSRAVFAVIGCIFNRDCGAEAVAGGDGA